MFRQEILIALAVLGLILIGLTACKPTEQILTKDQIFNKALFDACNKSNSKSCLSDTFMSRTGNYCLTKGLSESECNKLKLEVMRDINARVTRQSELLDWQIDTLRKENQQLERQLGK
jgi:hypothetical protein